MPLKSGVDFHRKSVWSFSLATREIGLEWVPLLLVLFVSKLLSEPDMWSVGYFFWELALLEELGFGLDVGKCVVTGETEDLRYISPKSGCAVSIQAAGEWANRLLPMPRIMSTHNKKMSDVFDGLQVLSYFWENKVSPGLNVQTLPTSRVRFLDIMQRHTARQQ